MPPDCPAVSKARERGLGNDTLCREAFGDSAEAVQGCGACKTNCRKDRVLQRKSLWMESLWSVHTVATTIIFPLHTIRQVSRGCERGERSRVENTRRGLGTSVS